MAKKKRPKGEVLTKLYNKQEGKCYYCQKFTHYPIRNKKDNKVKPCEATLEHLIPRSKGGTNKLANLAMACYACNSDRGNLNYRHHLGSFAVTQSDLNSIIIVIHPLFNPKYFFERSYKRAQPVLKSDYNHPTNLMEYIAGLCYTMETTDVEGTRIFAK